MQINYIILAHRYPKQVKRLIKKLSDPDSFFFIHIDKNVSIEPFLSELANLENLSFVHEREEGTWGDIGIVNATLNTLKQIVRCKKNGYCILLSGQDYPIKSNVQIKTYLNSNYGNEFIDIFSLPVKFLSVDRIEKYKFNLSARKEDFIQISSILQADFFSMKTFVKIYLLIKSGHYKVFFKILKRRKHPNYIKPYGGSQWWALTTKTVEKIINFTNKYPDFQKYHTYSLLPDEMFFQSIVMFLSKNENDIKIMPSPMYVNWERKNCELPVTFQLSDFEELSFQPSFKLFARKFDITTDSEILSQIDVFHSETN